MIEFCTRCTLVIAWSAVQLVPLLSKIQAATSSQGHSLRSSHPKYLLPKNSQQQHQMVWKAWTLVLQTTLLLVTSRQKQLLVICRRQQLMTSCQQHLMTSWQQQLMISHQQQLQLFINSHQ